MADDSDQPRDLLGDPWTPPRDPRGRKRHRRSALVAEKVAVLRMAGETVEAVALRLGLSEPTLRKYYFRELEQGPALARQVLVERMYAKAMDGSVAAARFIREELEKGEAARAAASIAAREKAAGAAPQAKAAGKVGKKEERQLAAERVQGLYAPPKPPTRPH